MTTTAAILKGSGERKVGADGVKTRGEGGKEEGKEGRKEGRGRGGKGGHERHKQVGK